MKEIIYIQAGRLSNYTGTHFWNTQQCYLPSNDGEDVVDSKVSFCESRDEQGKLTLCPRVLIIDQKRDFGNLESSPAAGELVDTFDHSTWTGSTVEYREESVSRTESKQGQETPSDIRYWSDFSQIDFLPRSLHRLPDTNGFDWQEGAQAFSRLNQEVELIDGPLRLLAEDCDNMQGIQILNDTMTFGGFMTSLLTCFRDEYGKLPSLTFSMQVLDSRPSNDTESRRFFTEALYFRDLHEFSSMNVPVQEPSSWSNFFGHNASSDSIYHESALLSSHLESSTLPFRLSPSHTQAYRDMASILGHLKSQNDTCFGELSGIFPVEMNFNEQDIVGFSAGNKPADTRMDVIRGFSSNDVMEGYEQWSSKSILTSTRCIDSIQALAYPLPSSFPPLIQSKSQYPSRKTKSLESTPMFSSLSSTSAVTAQRFRQYATYVDMCIKRKPYTFISMGFTVDETRELANALWSICDNSGDVDVM